MQVRLERTTLKEVAKSITLQVSNHDPCVAITLDTDVLASLHLNVNAFTVRCDFSTSETRFQHF